MSKETTEKQDTQELNRLVTLSVMASANLNGLLIGKIHENTSFGDDIQLNQKVIIEELKKASKRVKEGDLSDLETMLTTQAYSLQQLFMTMASKVSGTTVIDEIDLFARYALKAQNQCRTTIATLAEIKNPKRATFIKQTNQANQMQVNNGFEPKIKSSKKTDNLANELLEQKQNERLDTRTAQETIRNDKEMATVEKINRS